VNGKLLYALLKVKIFLLTMAATLAVTGTANEESGI